MMQVNSFIVNFKIICKVALFLIIFAVLYNFVFSVLWLDKNSIYYFFKEERDTMDIVYIGSSNVYVQFNSTLAYDEYGFTTGLLSTYAIPFSSYEYLLKESRNYQNAQLYIIDLLGVSWPYESDESGIRLVTDSMPNSINRFIAVNTLLQESNITENRLSYYFSFIKYHSKWKEMDSYVYWNDYYKGFYLSALNIAVEEQTYSEWINEEGDLEEVEDVLINLLDYIKDENLNVLFVVPCRTYTEKAMKKINRAISIINDYDYVVINFYLNDDIGINYATDLYNAEHLNIYGATKFTLYFGKYLVENYELPDHRGDSNYSSWNSEYARFKERYYELTGGNFNELVENYLEENY